MKFECVKAADFTCEWLEVRGTQNGSNQHRKTSGCPSAPQVLAPGAIRKALAKQWLLHTDTTGWVDDLKASSQATASAAAEREEVIAYFNDFLTFGEIFSSGGKADADKSSEVFKIVK